MTCTQLRYIVLRTVKKSWNSPRPRHTKTPHYLVGYLQIPTTSNTTSFYTLYLNKTLLTYHRRSPVAAKMMEYFNHKISRKHHPPDVKSEMPVLTEEDEEFLQRIASEGTPPPLPERPQQLPVAGETHGNNAQLALMHDARNTPLPDIPDTPDEDDTPVKDAKGKGKAKSEKRPMTWNFLRRDSRDRKTKAHHTTGVDLHSGAEGMKTENPHVGEDGVVTPHEGTFELRES